MIVIISNLICRNPSVKFSDVYPREDDDDKTWRGDDSWRVNAGKLDSLMKISIEVLYVVSIALLSITLYH